MVTLKTAKEIDQIRKSCVVVAEILDFVQSFIEPGVSTGTIDNEIEKFTRSKGAQPAFKGYFDYPAAACISIDDQVVHGIPGKRVIETGQIVSVDVGTIIDGWYGDGARTFFVGEVTENKKKLVRVTEESLYQGIEQARAGNRIQDIGSTIQKYVEQHGFSVVRDLVGHGIGRKLHEEPQVPNYGEPGRGMKLQVGMVLAIEPMVNEGTYEVITLEDKWTVVTKDRRPSAHFEHTIAITKNGPEILTQLN
jgi:methionyl aminopeptidase